MTQAALYLFGNLLYFIGAIILVPAGLIILTSPSTLMLAGPLALLIPLGGFAIGGTGAFIKHHARQREENAQVK